MIFSRLSIVFLAMTNVTFYYICICQYDPFYDWQCDIYYLPILPYIACQFDILMIVSMPF